MTIYGSPFMIIWHFILVILCWCYGGIHYWTNELIHFLCILTYAITYVLMHHIIFWLYLYFLNILYFFKYSCANIFHRRSLCTFYWELPMANAVILCISFVPYLTSILDFIRFAKEIKNNKTICTYSILAITFANSCRKRPKSWIRSNDNDDKTKLNYTSYFIHMTIIAIHQIYNTNFIWKCP